MASFLGYRKVSLQSGWVEQPDWSEESGGGRRSSFERIVKSRLATCELRCSGLQVTGTQAFPSPCSAVQAVGFAVPFTVAR